MKKIIFLFVISLLAIKAYSFVPEKVKGIWEGKDRYLFIGENGDFSVILKLYNGWYFDRFSQNDKFEEKNTRERNAASSREPVIVNADFENISEIENFPAFEMVLYEKSRLIQKIPVALSDDKIYLKFWIRIPTVNDEDGINGKEVTVSSLETKSIPPDQAEQYTNTQGFFGYWQAINTAENIRISEMNRNESIYSYFILPEAVYRLRFWKTDMTYDGNTKAAFTDDENLFRINKHIFSGNQTFTCTSGRSLRIRNVQKFSTLPFECKTDETGFLLLEGDADFIKCNESSKEELLQIVKEANSRRKPDPPLLFPEKELDFHWDLIDTLEKDNKIIQEVRERQRKFGPRGKDRNK